MRKSEPSKHLPDPKFNDTLVASVSCEQPDVWRRNKSCRYFCDAGKVAVEERPKRWSGYVEKAMTNADTRLVIKAVVWELTLPDSRWNSSGSLGIALTIKGFISYSAQPAMRNQWRRGWQEKSSLFQKVKVRAVKKKGRYPPYGGSKQSFLSLQSLTKMIKNGLNLHWSDKQSSRRETSTYSVSSSFRITTDSVAGIEQVKITG